LKNKKFLLAFILSLLAHIFLLSLLLLSQNKLKKNDQVRVEISLIEIKKEDAIKSQPNHTHYDKNVVATKTPASQEAPDAPSAEEWAFASKYKLKNSKGYRHSFGKQVRSMMGTAVEGPDQGQVKFRIEIAPNGQVMNVETLWKTSDVAESLARKAILAMTSLPPTPTGKSLIFERTISFTPFAIDDTPIYSEDCLPDPPSFSNPFAWDGKSPQQIVQNSVVDQTNPETLAECLKQLPTDTIEGIVAHDQRQLDRWSSNKLNQAK
jgi:hypothetical protein